MPLDYLENVAAILRRERQPILKAWENEVRKMPVAHHLDERTIIDHIGDMLDELARELETCADETTIEGLKDEPVTHGLQRLSLNFQIEEVVADYNALRNVIQYFLEKDGFELKGMANYCINRVIDKSIGVAVKTFNAQKAREIKERRDEHLMFITHDLRSPLAAISLATHLFEKGLNGRTDERTQKFLTSLRRNLDQLNAHVVKLINEGLILDEEASLKITQRPVDLRQLADKIINDLNPLAQASGTLMVNDVPAGLQAFADDTLLDLVFQNLIANAIRYTPAGKITIGGRPLPGERLVGCWVKDNGAGIPRDRLDKIFNKHETDPDRKGGFGLGLAIVKRFIEAHEGTVSVESTVGEGSTFRFTLPQHN